MTTDGSSRYGTLIIICEISRGFQEEYPRRPDKPQNTERVQRLVHHVDAVNALQQFSRLPKSEKAAIKESLESSLITMEQWLKHLGQSNFQTICMGELHDESTRDFLAEEFFEKVSADVLLLEATPKKLKRSIKRMEAGRDYFPLLDADIMNILRTVKKRNPNIMIWGIEVTEAQEKKQRGQSNSRDQSIARNFWDRFQPGKRNIFLFGALHCTNESNWLFNNLCHRASFPLKERMLNVRVLGEHQNGTLEAFVYFVDEIGIEKKHFVVSNTHSLHPRIYKWFQLLNRQTLEKYRSLVVFRM